MSGWHLLASSIIHFKKSCKPLSRYILLASVRSHYNDQYIHCIPLQKILRILERVWNLHRSMQLQSYIQGVPKIHTFSLIRIHQLFVCSQTEHENIIRNHIVYYSSFPHSIYIYNALLPSKRRRRQKKTAFLFEQFICLCIALLLVFA